MTGFKYSQFLKIETFAFVMACAAFVTGFIGWAEAFHWQLIDKSPEIVVRMIRIFVPGSANLDDGNSLTRIAAILGLLSAMSGVLLFWFAATGRSIDNSWTRLGRRHHRLILGETEFAQSIHDVLKKEGVKAIRVVVTVDAMSAKKVVAGVLPIGYETETLVTRAGALRSSHIIVDAGSDVETLDLARRLIAEDDATPTALLRSISIRVADNLLGLRFVELIAEERRKAPRSYRLAHISIFNQNVVAARYLLSTVPLFPRATARSQSRVHALVIGGGDAAEKMLDQVFLTTVAGDLQPSRVTIVDRNAGEMRRKFESHRPGVIENLAIDFVELNLQAEPLEGPNLSDEAIRLQSIEAECAFTAIILADTDDTVNIRTALLITTHQQRDNRMKAPILCCLTRETAIAATLFPQAPTVLEAETGAFFVTLPSSALRDAALGDPAGHVLARNLHDAYRAGEGKSAAGDQDWAALPETLRQSNMRSADHLAAMLWSAGLTGPDGLTPATDRDTRVKRLLDLIRTEPHNPEVQHLARIEHDRWCVDRWLDGWRYGPVRDDLRRIHPLLISFEDLRQQPVEVAKDVDRVGAMLKHLLIE